MTKSEVIAALPQTVNEINITLLVIVGVCAIAYAAVWIRARLSDRALLRKINRAAVR